MKNLNNDNYKTWMKEVYIYIIHTIKYYSATRKKESLPFLTTWIDHEDILLSNINQKNKHCMTALIYRI